MDVEAAWRSRCPLASGHSNRGAKGAVEAISGKRARDGLPAFTGSRCRRAPLPRKLVAKRAAQALRTIQAGAQRLSLPEGVGIHRVFPVHATDRLTVCRAGSQADAGWPIGA